MQQQLNRYALGDHLPCGGIPKFSMKWRVHASLRAKMVFL